MSTVKIHDPNFHKLSLEGGPMVHGTTVSLDGVPLKGITSMDISMNSRGVITAKIEMVVEVSTSAEMEHMTVEIGK